MIHYKNTQEIELMRESALLVSKTLSEVAVMLKPGITTLSIDIFIGEFLRDHKAIPSFLNFNGYPYNSCISVNDVVVHGFPGDYELCEGDCAACGGKFTLRRPLSAPPLTNCPACKRPVRKLLSNFSSPIKLKPLSVTDAKKAGFTVLKKTGKGEYERQ